MEIIKTRITTEVSNWKEIAKAIRNGTIKEWVSVGDILTVNHSEYGLLDFDVLDFDRDMPADRPPCSTVTLQLHDLVLPEIPFDKNGGNSWENSSIRAWLNDREFMDGFNPEFASLIVPVNKVTNQNTEKEEHTEDSFFLLSKEEIAVDGYVYYANRRNLVKFNTNDSTDWWWLRSAYRGYAYSAWIVYSTGYVSISHAVHAYRCAPACVIC